MSPLPDSERRACLGLARRAIAAAVNHTPAPELPATPEAPSGHSSAFVSLYRHGRLRGCVGQVEAPRPLAAVVARCAVSAALEDSRFEPVRPDEFPELEIEISVLSGLREICPEEIEVGVHGLLVRQGYFSGLLLPQVATKYNWTSQHFLEETCRKAGLAADAWKDPACQLRAFTAEVFAEADYRSAASGP